jgi:hypothetical protein
METSSGEILHLNLTRGREIERYNRERKEETRKQQGGDDKSS